MQDSAAGSRSHTGSRNLVLVVAAGCAALVVFLLFDQRLPAAIAKVIASTAFVALAIHVGALRSVYGRIIVLGLVFGWCGDVLLIGTSTNAFLAGLAAFLLAHLAYIAAFIARGLSVRWTLLAAVPVVAAALVVSDWLTPHLASDLLLPVRVYTAAISLMVILAFGTRGRGAPALILVGAVLFFVSDLSVAALRLVQTDYPTYVWGLPFYYAGQACLALSSREPT